MFNKKKQPIIFIAKSNMTREDAARLAKASGRLIVLVDDVTQVKAIDDIENSVEGDGQGAFLGEGTHEEYIDLEREDKGLKAWYKRLGL